MTPFSRGEFRFYGMRWNNIGTRMPKVAGYLKAKKNMPFSRFTISHIFWEKEESGTS
jgi:hypothetical protein